MIELEYYRDYKGPNLTLAKYGHMKVKKKTLLNM